MSYPRHSFGESYLSVEMQSVYSTAPADCVNHILDTRLESLFPSAKMQSVYSTVSADWARHSLGESFPICRYAVSVFYSLSQYGQELIGEVFSHLQRYSQCILQPQPTGPDTRWESLFPSVDMQSVYSTASVNMARHSLGKSFPICRDTASVFYSICRLSQTLVLLPFAEMQSVYSKALFIKDGQTNSSGLLIETVNLIELMN